MLLLFVHHKYFFIRPLKLMNNFVALLAVLSWQKVNERVLVCFSVLAFMKRDASIEEEHIQFTGNSLRDREREFFFSKC